MTSPATVAFGPAASRATAQANARRLADTAANRAALQAEAAKDRLPSAIVDLGSDVVLLSGKALETKSRIAKGAGPALAAGEQVAVDGAQGTVLTTDDGFAEIDASDVIVAIVDSGMDVNHPAFKGRVVGAYNAVTGTTDVTDVVGHGTHVAGIAAGAWGVDAESAGVASNAKIMPIKATNNAQGAFKTGDIAKGIRYAADHGAKVINLSLGGPLYMPSLREAIQYAESKGVVVIAASGNNGKNKVSYPARFEEAVSVGSSKDGKRSRFSNGGDRLDVSAPGEKIRSAVPGGGYGAKSGTSMASPYVAGAAALVVAQHPDWTPAQVKEHLKRAVNDLGAPGWDRDFGYGEVNLFKAAYGENLAAVYRDPNPPKPSLWERILGFFGLA
jgi:subtilisin family serine protease